MKVLVVGDLNADLIFSGVSSLLNPERKFWQKTSLWSWAVPRPSARRVWRALARLWRFLGKWATIWSADSALTSYVASVST